MVKPSPKRRLRVSPLSNLNNDLTVEVLLRLPAKSIGRFRSACKLWHSLTSDPKFVLTHAALAPVSGFLLRRGLDKPLHFPLRHGDRSSLLPDSSLSSLPEAFLCSSTGGLILCSHLNRRRGDPFLLHVCNPLTRAYTIVTAPDNFRNFEFSLYFDPAASPHFKIIRLLPTRIYEYFVAKIRFEIHIYSSAAQSWRQLACDLPDELDGPYGPYLSKGVLWNGGMVWLAWPNSSLIFLDGEGEVLTRLPCALPRGKCFCFGESGGRLHVMRYLMISDAPTKFDILEMESDCSGWSVLYHVDVGSVYEVYPEAIAPPTPEQPMGPMKYGISMLYFYHGGNGGDRLLFSVHGMIICYNLQGKSFARVCDVPRPSIWESSNLFVYYCLHFSPHVHTLFSPGEPTTGKARPETILRQVTTKKGQVIRLFMRMLQSMGRKMGTSL